VAHLVFLRSARRLLVAACVVPSSPILVTLMKEAPPKRRFLQEPHGVTSQKTPFFKNVAVLLCEFSYELTDYFSVRNKSHALHRSRVSLQYGA
jgi:hypothetical protein